MHDRDIKRWALKKAKKLNLHSFKASDTWVCDFKKRHNICIRKVTKFVTNTPLKDINEIFKIGKEFADKMKSKLKNSKINSNKIFNFDQSGFNYEQTSGRTLAKKGDRNL